MLAATLTTAETCRFSSASALTLSRSAWSMMAMSPGLSRSVSDLVRRSRRAGAVKPGRSVDPFPSLLCSLREYSHIALPSVPDRLRPDVIVNSTVAASHGGSPRHRRPRLGRPRLVQLGSLGRGGREQFA